MMERLKYQLKQVDVKKICLLNLPYVFIGLFFAKVSQAYRLAEGVGFVEKIKAIGEVVNSLCYAKPTASSAVFFGGEGFSLAFGGAIFDLQKIDLIFAVVIAVGFKWIVHEKSKDAKKFRKGVEYGSARWGNKKDIQPFIDYEFENNVILTKTERLMMGSRPKDPKDARNKNVLIIGGSGSGKTRFWLKPNLMQMHSSYVVTDPKGSILVECGKMLQRGSPKRDKNGKIIKTKDGKTVLEPYQIRVLNTINFKKSMKYNPFAYIREDKDILKLVSTLIANTTGDKKGGDDFWEKAERLLYSAYISLIVDKFPKTEKNFNTLIELINASETREDDESYKNAVDIMFEALEQSEPQHYAVRQYRAYKLAAGKTAKSILISCSARLSPFDIKELRELTEYDELELDTLGDRKTALFFIISDTDDTFNFLVSMAYTQLFNLLCEKADDVYGGRLPVHVRCLIDECANIGKIPNLEKLMATIRSREISACLVLQAQSQLKAIYKDNADTITGNCDSMVFLGGKEKSTLKEITEMLGKETIDSFNTSDTRGQSRSMGVNFQKLGKELLTMDEISTMDGSKCILQLRGVRPFFSDKFDITKHKQYPLLSDYDEKNTFSIEEFLNTELELAEEDMEQMVVVKMWDMDDER